jgi:hypothetical protein
MKEDLQSIGLAYIKHSQQEGDTKRPKTMIREKSNDIEGQSYSGKCLKRFHYFFPKR